MNTLQKLLITRLVKDNGVSYSKLTSGYDSEDNIAFHLKQLLSKGLIEKREDKYFITVQGLNTLTTFQKTDLQENTFKMFFVGFVCKCEDSYLIKVHNTEKPFYNLPSGSPLFGEKLEDSLSRIFNQETGIYVESNNFEYDSLHLKTVKTKDGEVIFDDAFGIYRVNITKEQKEKMHLNNGNTWLKIIEIEKLNNKWIEVDYCVLRNDWESYKTYDVICDYVLK